MPAESIRRRDLLYGAHLVLALAFGIGRGLAWIQSATLQNEWSFVTSPAGRGLALAAMVLGMAALAAIAALTVLERREFPAIVLLGLFVAAIWSRSGLDALDVLYASASVVVGAWWFLGRRRRPEIAAT